ncbi:NAD-dependent epimerase/dehydratase family protein [Flagellimonas lutimaris]|uniref:NAD-dependent epimerase/dehydratase family protein n=1 Tax=Flagellimonas lutimaris TaxID=475082 RepID=A0A3A1NAF8_9FLAO|nr:NAD-dependent epimerase/dehydratase [Allomuricauda lutimaris]RIV34992.1 NAD-dependent epimerase/dehydratase family protein [Allomuricauda lutimaris]
MKSILITGANGFLGSHLVVELSKEFNVIGLVRSTQSINRIKNQSIKIYSSEDPLEKIFKENKIFAVIHTATVYKKKNDSIIPLFKTNIELPVRLAELCNSYKVKAFLNTDSFFNSSTYSYSYLSEYTLTKKHTSEWLNLLSKTNVFKLVNLKLFHMYGETDSESKFVPSLVSQITKGSEAIKMTKGEQTRDFIYIKDVVSAYRQVLCSIEELSHYEEFDVGTGVETSIKEFTNLTKAILECETKILFGAIPYREGEIMKSKAETIKLCKLGWKPSFSLEKGLKEYLS